MRSRAYVATVAGALSLAACEQGTDAPSVSAVTVTPDNASVSVDSTVQLRAAVTGSNGAELAREPVAWTSSDTLVIAIDSKGLARARRPGTANVSAASGGKTGMATLVVPVPAPTVAIVAVNALAPAGDTLRVADSLRVRVRIARHAEGDPLSSVDLVRVGSALTEEVVASLPLSGGALVREVEMRTLAVPSGPGKLFARVHAETRSHASAAVPIALSRPATRVEILSVNGLTREPGVPLAVADSFRLRVRVTVADTGTAPTRLFVKQSVPQSEDQIGLLIHHFTPGTTTDTVFTAYVVRPGTYDLIVYTVTQGPASRVFSPPYPVAVTQSDVTPPVIVPISPLDGETVGDSSVAIVWDASDNRLLWKYGLEMYGDDPMRSCGMSGGFPNRTALSAAVRRVSVGGCALQPGLNRVTMNVTDGAGNSATRTVMVRYVRAVQSANP